MSQRVRAGIAAMVALTVVLGFSAPASAATPYTVTPVAGTLRSYNISKVYVAGVSSGAYMASQLQVAYSGRIKGAALFAAGPYYCAQNNASRALYACGDNIWSSQLSTLQASASLWSGYGWIDPISQLSGQPVYAFHGGSDSTVKKSVTDDLVRFYQHFGSSVQYNSTTSAGHGWVSPYGTGACAATVSPFINDCGIDPQQAMFAKLYGSVNARNTGPLTGTLIKFDQNTFAVNGLAAGLSMGGSGFAYVPAGCASGQSCRLLVALHGCSQGYNAIGKAFIDRANLAQYADTNATVVLYPQATSSGVNPYGCWDWWGYLGYTNYPIQGGRQLETIMNMVRRLDG